MTMNGISVLFSFLALLIACSFVDANDARACEGGRYNARPRVFVATDMGNEPDDQMSLVRFLTYANEFDVRGIVGSTSTWKNDSIDEPTIRRVISAYGNITTQLNAHVPPYAQYPPASELLAKVSSGHPVYGLAALELPLSDAAVALVQAIDEATTEKPQWVLLWGGEVILAEALNHVSKTRDADAIAAFVAKIRAYAISDQDDTGAWIREEYPSLFFIVSVHAWSEYQLSTWAGISGEGFYHFDEGGPDTSLVTNEWLQEHIRIGEFGSHYPEWEFIMEGDTPTFLGLIQNGLGDTEHPEYGSWGGRYERVDVSGRSSIFSNVADYVRGQNGNNFMTPQGTIWRWRKDYQWDFANRMQWTTTTDYSQANHAPIVSINNTCGPDILTVPYTFNNVSNNFVLDASASWDPDNDVLEFNWLWYRDVTFGTTGNTSRLASAVAITELSADGALVNVSITRNSTVHVILSVTDLSNVTTYQRVIFDPTE